MNIVLIVAVVIIIASALAGLGRGLIKSILSTFALIVAIVLALQIMPYGTKLLKTTQLYTTINDSIQSAFEDKLEVVTEGVGQQMEGNFRIFGVRFQLHYLPDPKCHFPDGVLSGHLYYFEDHRLYAGYAQPYPHCQRA